MSGEETSNNGQPATSVKDAVSSEISSTVMALRIKSLEQQTKPVTISRDASVLDLKQAVQTAFQVESQRQRLIFQGKVLKDEKNLTDYANLDNGKVVHLVVRPADVPQNPQNDDPRPQSSGNRRTFARGIPFSRLFPITGRPPAMEGYTFITLDVGDPGHHLSSLMDGLGNLFPSTNLGAPPRPRATPGNTNASNGRPATPSTPTQNSSVPRVRVRESNTNTPYTSTTSPSRAPFEFTLGPRSASDLGPSNTSDIRSATGGPFPPSVEVRLMRTMSCMRNVRTILDTPPDQSIHGIATASTTPPEQNQEIRSRLRSNGNSQTAAVGMVLDELATLMTDVVPRLQEMSEALRAGDRSPNNEEHVQLYRRVLRTARVVQGMSLINHFLGSVLAAADISPSRRTRSRTPASPSQAETTSTNPTPTTTTTTEQQEEASSSSSSSSNNNNAVAADEQPSDDATRGTKRKHDDDANEGLSTSQDKGKRRDSGDDR